MPKAWLGSKNVKEFQKNLNRFIKLVSITEELWANLLSPRYELYNHLVRDFRDLGYQSLLQFDLTACFKESYPRLQSLEVVIGLSSNNLKKNCS